MASLFDRIKPNEKRIYIIPTKFGFSFLVVIFVLFLISLSYGHSLALSTTFVFVSVVIASAHFTNFNLHKIKLIGLHQSENCFEGDDLIIEMALENEGARERFGIRGELYRDSSLSTPIDLERGEVSSGQIKMPKLARGCYVFEKIKLASDFPFGLFYSWKVLAAEKEFFVFPRPRSFYPFPEASHENEEGGEGANSVYHKGSDDFFGHKNFEEGESWKNIDWKVFSRTNRLVKKVFSDQSEGKVFLSYSSLKNLTLEEKLSQLAYWIEIARSKGLPIGLELPGIPLKFGHSPGHYHDLLVELAKFSSAEIQEVVDP